MTSDTLAPAGIPSADVHTGGERPRAALARVVPLALAIVAGAVAAFVLLTGTGQLLAFVVIGGALGLFIVYAAVARFELFLLSLLVARSSLDLTDNGASSATAKPAALLAMMMIGVSVVWLWDNRRALPRRRWTMLSVGFATFAVVAALSVTPLVDPMPVFGDVLAVVAGLLMYLCVERLLVLGMPLTRLMGALALSTLVPLGAGLIGDDIGLSVWHVKEGVRALRSTFVLSNNFAYYLMPVVLIAIPVGHRLKGNWKLGLYTLAGVGSIEMILTYTCGAWIGFGIGIIVVGLLENRRIIVGLVVLCAVGFMLVPGVRERVSDLGTDSDSPRDESSLEWRLDQWSEIIPWQESNRVTGIGIGMVYQLDEENKAPHNDYVRAYVETGYLGLGAYLVMMFGYVRAAVFAHRRRLPGWRGGLAVGLLAYAIAFACTSLAENLIVSIAFLWYAMTLGAVANWMAFNDPSIADDPDDEHTHPRAPVRRSREVLPT